MNKLDVPPKIKELVMYRDKGCVYCGITSTLTYAHIFVSRAKGGLGKKENIVMLCMRHHHILDNGVDSKMANKIDQHCKSYLHDIYGQIDLRELVFNKWKNIIPYKKER